MTKALFQNQIQTTKHRNSTQYQKHYLQSLAGLPDTFVFGFATFGSSISCKTVHHDNTNHYKDNKPLQENNLTEWIFGETWIRGEVLLRPFQGLFPGLRFLALFVFLQTKTNN